MCAPPLGDEMNKCRQDVRGNGARARGARRGDGDSDLYGTGDSAGEFAEADCDIWLDDLQRVCAWSAGKNWRVRAILCVRLGCILGARFAEAPAAEATAVFWQPVVDGERFLNQLLRLRVAASMMETDRRESIGDLRKVLAEGAALSKCPVTNWGRGSLRRSMA